MKSILLHIDHDRAMTARLQVALDIARATNGHLTCLQAVSYEVFAPGDFYGSAIAAAMPVIKENAENLRAQTPQMQAINRALEQGDVAQRAGYARHVIRCIGQPGVQVSGHGFGRIKVIGHIEWTDVATWCGVWVFADRHRSVPR